VVVAFGVGVAAVKVLLPLLPRASSSSSAGIKVTFVPGEPGAAELKPIMDVTDSKGIATVDIIGRRVGSLNMSAKATIEGEQYDESIIIAVTQ
jgi:hypothetical protein